MQNVENRSKQLMDNNLRQFQAQKRRAKDVKKIGKAEKTLINLKAAEDCRSPRRLRRKEGAHPAVGGTSYPGRQLMMRVERSAGKVNRVVKSSWFMVGRLEKR